VPRIVFCNKMDKVGADFYLCVEEIKTKSAARPVPVQLPIGAESQFKGIIDLVRMKGVVWSEESLGAKFEDIEIPDDMKEKAGRVSLCPDRSGRRARRRRHGRLSRRPPSPTRRRCVASFAKAVITSAFFPVFCGSAFKNKGVQPLLDGVIDFLPSPLDAARSRASTTRPASRSSVVPPTTSRSRCSPSS